MTPRLLAIVGPTATGKTPLAVAVAEALGSTELLNADSRQVIRGLTVGTCAPTPDQLRGVRCHLLGVRDPDAHFSVADWVTAARSVLAGLDASGRSGLLVGGTGFYIEALVDGLQLGDVAPDPALRAQRDRVAATAEGLATLVGRLRRADAVGAATVDLRNPRRVVRALELVEAHGSLASARRRGPGRPAVMVGLDAPPALHDELIALRCRRLMGTGALRGEVDSALASGVSRDALERAGIGYREALAVRDGSLSPEQATEALIRRTKQYAQAQRTWFRRDPRIRWLERGAGPVEQLVGEVIDAVHQDARAGQRLPGRG